LLTQCLKCETIYRLDAADLAAAKGFVECGDCGEQFNALSRLADEPTSLTEPPNPDVLRSSPHPTPVSTPNDPAFVLIDSEDVADSLATVAEEETPQAPIAADLAQIDIDDVPAILKEEIAALSRPRRTGMGRFWVVLAFVLFSSLSLQLAWVFRGQIIGANPAAQAFYLQACERLGCRIETAEGTDRIELLARDVRDHPQYQETLLVNATLVSHSQTVTFFPVIQLGLFDNTGQVIGIRRFEPHEYLDKSIDLGGGMPPNRSVYIVLEVAGVGMRAVGFEFSFL
jgi:predicted Zn finger-like uncharacterized protein